MPYTMEDFERDYVREHLDVLTVEEILQRLPVEKLKAYLEKLGKEPELDKDKKD